MTIRPIHNRMPPAKTKITSILNHLTAIKAAAAIAKAAGDFMVAFESCKMTTASMPTKEARTPAKAPLTAFKFLTCTNNSVNISVITNDGENMANVANVAPNKPPILYPIKVAVIKNGPGVICPNAIPSTNWLMDNQ